MKNRLLSVVAAFAISSSHAQIAISPVVGLNLSGYTVSVNGTSYTDHLELKTGVCIGGLVDFPLKKNWSLQTGLLFKRNGFRSRIYDVNGNEAPGEFSELRVSTLDVPVKITWSFAMGKGHNLFIGAGPYVAVNLAATEHVHGHFYDDMGNLLFLDASRQVTIGGDNGMHRMDMGAGLNAGFRTRWGLLVAVQGQYGLLNLGAGDAKIHSYNFGVIGGYAIKLKKKTHTAEPAKQK